MAVMSADFCDLLFVTLDTPVGPDVISINEAVLFFLSFSVGKACSKTAQNYLSRYIHQLLIGDINLNNNNKIPNQINQKSNRTQ